MEKKTEITIEKAIDILSEEMRHTAFHYLNDKGKAPEYYQEMGDYWDALQMAIDALKKENDELKKEENQK